VSPHSSPNTGSISAACCIQQWDIVTHGLAVTSQCASLGCLVLVCAGQSWSVSIPLHIWVLTPVSYSSICHQRRILCPLLSLDCLLHWIGHSGDTLFVWVTWKRYWKMVTHSWEISCQSDSCSGDVDASIIWSLHICPCRSYAQPQPEMPTILCPDKMSHQTATQCSDWSILSAMSDYG
jgi:hypothetical protein